MSSKVVALISILTFAVNHVRGDCYTRDGTAAKASRYYNGPELVACGRNSQTCCLAGQKCGSNLLCSEGPKLTREYCANKNWENCSPLGAEILPYGITLNECGQNLVCYNSTDCCTTTNGTPIYYVNPKTGEVKEASQQQDIDTTSAVFWNASESTTSSASLPSSTPSSTPSVSSPSNSPSSSPSTSPSPNEPKKSSGISSRVGAGIGVGCVIAAAGLFALGFFFLRRRRNSRATQAHTDHPGAYQHHHDAKEGPQTEIYQLTNDEQPTELSAKPRRVHEMP